MDPYVYDKAKYHFESCDEHGLDLHQAYVHTGIFLAWLEERGLLSDWMAQEMGSALADLHARSRTGPAVFEEMDGVLLDEMLSADGNAFAMAYFDFDRGVYLEDYDELLSGALASHFHVEDTWTSYERIRPRIDERFAQWRAGELPAKSP